MSWTVIVISNLVNIIGRRKQLLVKQHTDSSLSRKTYLYFNCFYSLRLNQHLICTSPKICTIMSTCLLAQAISSISDRFFTAEKKKS